jgi:hypothetical protein
MTRAPSATAMSIRALAGGASCCRRQRQLRLCLAAAIGNERRNGVGASQPPLVVVGSANVDLVLDVERLPLVGETISSGCLKTFAGGKASLEQ